MTLATAAHRGWSAGALVALALLAAACERYGPGEPRCLDSRQPVTFPEPLPIGFRAQDVLAFAMGARRGILTWPDGESIGIQQLLETPQPFFVQSRRNPEYMNDDGFTCSDHLLLEGALRLSSDDGHLDQAWPLARIRSQDGRAAQATLTMEAGDLKGRFGPDPGKDVCVRRLQFDASYAPGQFTGRVMKEIATAPCGKNADAISVGPATTGTWR